jgi:hypothetical protein
MKITHAMVSLLLIPLPLLAQDTYADSDDFKERTEVVNVFLHESEYRLMVEDIERNDEEFDWGWVKTSQAQPQSAPAAEEKKGRFARLRSRLPRRGPDPTKPGALGFDLRSYGKVSLSVQNFAGVVPEKTLAAVREAFTLAAQQLGLAVVKDGAPLELGIAVVDIKRDSTYAYVATIEPFIELEVRLRDAKTGENLVLIRNQAHSTTPEDAAFRYADVLVKFLR